MAVEFAIVALPFITIVFAIFELAVVLLIFATLENGMADAARQIRTGALQKSGTTTTKDTFRTTICNNMGWLQSDCIAKLEVDVRTVGQFSNPTLPDPFATGQYDDTKTMMSLGSQGSVVVVRAWYPWTLVLPTMNAGLSRANNGVALIQATTTFKNEPYS